MTRRLEITVSEDVFDRIERVRGDVPRAAWIKKSILGMLVIVEDGDFDRAPRAESSPRKVPPHANRSSYVEAQRGVEELRVEMARKLVEPHFSPRVEDPPPLVVRASDLPQPETRYVCRHGDFSAPSPKARCPRHGGALVPE